MNKEENTLQFEIKRIGELRDELKKIGVWNQAIEHELYTEELVRKQIVEKLN